MDFLDFFEDVLSKVLEYFNIYYGVYSARVVANNDPEERGRVKVYAHGIHIEENGPDVWVDPSFDGAGTERGKFWPPEVGDDVKIRFYRGRPDLPHVYFGGWYAKVAVAQDVFVGEQHPDFEYSAAGYPESRGMVTRKGHRLVFNDESGKEAVKLIWHKPPAGDDSNSDRSATAAPTQGSTALMAMSNDGILLMNQTGSIVDMKADGTISLMNSSGDTVSMKDGSIGLTDSSGNFISLSAGQLSISVAGQVDISTPVVSVNAGAIVLGDGATEPVVLGNKLKNWITKHTHPTGVGPSGPPKEPFEGILSTKNTTQ